MKKVIFCLCTIPLAGLVGYYIRQDHKAQAQAQAEPPHYLAGPWIGPNKDYDNSSLIMKVTLALRT